MNSRKSTTQQARSKHSVRHGGFTLIEILVSLIILAVGFLGLAALQTNSVRGTQATYFRTQADLLINDLAERMRSNRAGSAALAYAFTGGAAPSDPGCGATAQCTSTNLATSDLNEWVTWVQAALPAGDATVQSLGANFWQIRVMWDERRNGAVGLNCDPDDTADLACLTINVEIRGVENGSTFF